MENTSKLKVTLAAEYLKILNEHQTSISIGNFQREKISGLFLCGFLDGYADAVNKIMIVGRETAGWSVIPSTDSVPNEADYIDKATQKSAAWLKNRLALDKNEKGRTFFNFVKDVAARSGSDGLIHANLFCADFKNGDPRKGTLYPQIRKMSEELLKLQIQTLQPKTIIFANGTDSADVRGEYFPTKGDKKVSTDGKDFYISNCIKNKHLWAFRMGDIQCYRIQHPAAYGKDANTARNFLINELLPAKS